MDFAHRALNSMRDSVSNLPVVLPERLDTSTATTRPDIASARAQSQAPTQPTFNTRTSRPPLPCPDSARYAFVDRERNGRR